MLETIQQLLHREPFHLFRINVTSGDRYEVLNPFLVALGESQLFYCYPRWDRFAFIRLNQIVSVDPMQPAANEGV